MENRRGTGAMYHDVENRAADAVPLLESHSPPLRDNDDDDYSGSDSDLDAPLIASLGASRDPTFSFSKSGFLNWGRGPEPSVVYRIRPIFPKWQTIPKQLVNQWLPSRRLKITLLLSGVLFWIILFFSLLKKSTTDQNVPGYGQPVMLSCHDRVWSNATDCGLDGELCRPFENKAFAFRCPSGCADAILLEPYVVGGLEYNYRPLVIGGDSSQLADHDQALYRGDSSICASALHAGLINDAKGGCGIVHRQGEHGDFKSVKQNGISSIPFQPHFPFSFSLARQSSTGTKETSNCSDIRWPLFGFTLAFTIILSIFVTSGPWFFSAVFFIIWTQIAMASDPPTTNFNERISIYVSRFVPAAFVGFYLYFFWIRRTLGQLNAHLEKTILWLGGCWVGALNTDTFGHIPISRLTPHDIKQQPGAGTALAIIISSLVAITLLQAHRFRRQGRFFSMLSLYLLFVSGLLTLLVVVPDMNLRIHHDLLAQLLIPGTSMQTRSALLFQGILVGLYINGVSRWGFGAILQTPAAMLDGAKLGTPPPDIQMPRVENQDHLVFSFANLPSHVDGISVLVNDVLRFEYVHVNDTQTTPEFDWHRRYSNEIEYFRFAHLHTRPLGGVWYEDFTDPAIWHINGTVSHL